METTTASICTITDKNQAFALIDQQDWSAKKKARARLAWKKKNDKESVKPHQRKVKSPPVAIPVVEEPPVAIPVAIPVATPVVEEPPKERLTIENARVGMIIKCQCQDTIKYFRIEEVFTKTIKVSYWNKVGKQLVPTDEQRPCRHYLQVKRIIHIVKK
jgi:hypothetical protein